MSAGESMNWVDANQRLLVAELERIKALLTRTDGVPQLVAHGAHALEGTDEVIAGVDGTRMDVATPMTEARGATEEVQRAIDAVETARLDLPEGAALDSLVELFGLTDFERDVLLLAAGVEMDTGVADACADALGHPRRPWATFGLALATFDDAHWSALAPSGPLRYWRLLEVDEQSGLTSARLKIDEHILHHLAGLDGLDVRLRPLLRLVEPPRLMAAQQLETANAVARAVEAHPSAARVVVLSGDDPVGQEDVAAHAAALLGVGLYVLPAQHVPADPHELLALTTLCQRQAGLSGHTLLVERADEIAGDVLDAFVARMNGLVFASTREPLQLARTTLHFTVDRPDAPGQRELWRATLGPDAERFDGTLDAIASQYRLSARTVGEAAGRVASHLEEGTEAAAVPWDTCLNVHATKLDTLAQRIRPTADWTDLVLPEAQKAILSQIVAHVRHRIVVYHEWGFAAKSSRGLGISVLFSGESGTGKTMAAEVLARELQLELYRIDLSAVVSKYIGETEKNLRRVFDAAEESGAILLFDEADALFGKRSEVKDSHDRYANIEVSYLLQRMEAYRGLAILTTNLKAALDNAFQRRLRFLVSFPFPDATQREAIWRGIFPAAAPLGDIDFGKLAQLNATGGNIQNIALSAAFVAAENGRSVEMAHLLSAARLDSAKRERTITDAETRGWV